MIILSCCSRRSCCLSSCFERFESRYNCGNCKHYACDSAHVVPYHITERIGMQLVSISESKVLRVIRAQNVYAAVDQFQQSLISDLYAETPVIIVCGLQQ